MPGYGVRQVGLIEPLDHVLAQLELLSRQRVLEMLELRRANDRGSDSGLVKQPGERQVWDLRSRGVRPRDFPKGIRASRFPGWRPLNLNRSDTLNEARAPNLCAMSTVVQPPRWPADPGHREAIDTLLLMAAAEDRWGESRRAIGLLDTVEEIVGMLPAPYERIRRRCCWTTNSPPIQ